MFSFIEIYSYLRSPYKDLGVYDSVVQVRTRCSHDKLRAHGLIVASLEKYDTPPGIPPPPSHERTRRWESRLASRSRSQSPNLRSSHSHSYPPSIREWNIRPEPSPAHSGEYDSRRPSSARGPTKDLIQDSSVSCRSGSRTHIRGKGKGRASTRSLSPPESDIRRGSPVARRERTGSPEALVALVRSSLFENSPEAHTSTSCAQASPSRTPESYSGGTPVFSSHGNSIANATHTDNLPPPLEGLRSLSHEIIASSSSKSETPERLTINTDRARANPMRQPRYRSQRDSIIAHLQGSALMPRRTRSLLTRMTDQTVTKLNVSGNDADDTGGGAVDDLPSRTAERSSGLSGSNASGGRDPKEAAVTKAGARLSCIICAGHLPRNASVNVNFVYSVNIYRSASATPAA